MSRGSINSLHAVESCAFKLLNWRPFAKTLDPDPPARLHGGPHKKHPCLTDRTTSLFSIDAILDMSKISLFNGDRALLLSASCKRWFAHKHRHRSGSRSMFRRSSDQKGCCSVDASGANKTCSDFPMAVGDMDSSGELFGDSNWAFDVNDWSSRRERGERRWEKGESSGGYGQFGNLDNQRNEFEYGSEPRYRVNEEIGYDDEEDDDPRVSSWGDEIGADNSSTLERVGKNPLQKSHQRGPRKKHNVRMVDTLR